jgi:sugar lactone lactonase YvrE
MTCLIRRIFILVLAVVTVGSGEPAAVERAPVGKTPTFVLAWGKRGKNPGEFTSPIGIAISDKDEIYVTDVNNARVQKFDTGGKYLGGFDLPWDTPPRVSCQCGGIAVDGDGLIYLAFMLQHKVCVYTDAGKLVREWGKHGNGDGEFDQPAGLLLARDGTLYVADPCNHRVQHFTREGKFLGKFGEYGKEPGQFGGTADPKVRFGGPHFIAADSAGNLFTTEADMGRVQRLLPQGKPLSAWGSMKSDPGGFGGGPERRHLHGPIGIVIDRHDRVWVSSLNDRVQAFTTDGKFLLSLGGSGSEPGQFSAPHAMVFDSKGYLYVVDARNQRIEKFEVSKP